MCISIKIENINNDAAVSISMDRIINLIKSDSRFDIVECIKSSDETKKCDVFTSISIAVVVNLATSALYDIIKLAFNGNPNKGSNCRITYDGKVIDIENLHNVEINLNKEIITIKNNTAK